MFDIKRKTKSDGYSVSSITLMIIMLTMLTTCADSDTTQLGKIKKRGEIVVVTRNGPASYYIEKNTDTGPEYVLAKRFADELGVNLKVIIAKNAPEVKQILNSEQADFAAAALINSQPRDDTLMYGPAYQWVTQQLVYRNGRRQPSSLNDISPDKLDLSADTLALLPLEQMQRQYPDISWNTHTDRDSHEMLELLENNEILYTITDSNELTLARQYYPEIRVALNVTPPQPVAWAFRKSDDLSLLQAVWRFYEEISFTHRRKNLITSMPGNSSTVTSSGYLHCKRCLKKLPTKKTWIGCCWPRSAIRNHTGMKRQ